MHKIVYVSFSVLHPFSYIIASEKIISSVAMFLVFFFAMDRKKGSREIFFLAG
jgi:hypothetical protein